MQTISPNEMAMDLLGIVGEDALTTQPEALAEVAVDGLTPMAVVSPSTEEQAAACLKYANQRGLKVAVRGGGTHTGLGNSIAGLDVVISTTRLNAITEYSPADLMIGVQAGVKLADIQAELEKNNQFLPVEVPGGRPGATIGGAIAINASGPLRLVYGPARDWLIGVKFALADGTLAKGGGKVVKNVAGFDMMKLFIGSLGTLGLIHHMNFKLMPLPPAFATLMMAFESSEVACQTALKLIDAGLFPSALTVLDSAAAKELGLPESSATLLVEVRNTTKAVERQINDISALGRTEGASAVESAGDRAAQKKLWQTVTDFGYGQRGSQDCALKVSALPSKSAEVIATSQRLADKYGLEVACTSQAGHGLTWVAAGYTEDSAAAQFIKELTSWAEKYGGSVAAERVSLSLKPHLEDVWGAALTPGEFKLMRSVKQKLDPNQTLNPGRFVGKI